MRRCVCACVCVCVRERERERHTHTHTHTDYTLLCPHARKTPRLHSSSGPFADRRKADLRHRVLLPGQGDGGGAGCLQLLRELCQEHDRLEESVPGCRHGWPAERLSRRCGQTQQLCRLLGPVYSIHRVQWCYGDALCRTMPDDTENHRPPSSNGDPLSLATTT